QLQDRRPQVQHGERRLQAVPQLPAQAPLPAVVQGISMMRQTLLSAATLAFVIGPLAHVPVAQAPQVAAAAAGVALAPDYVIGADDVLSIMFWRDKDLSAPEAVVRPDGKVTLPLLNDVQAAGRTPEELSAAIRDAARK